MIRLLSTMNYNIGGRATKKYYIDNRDKIIENQKQYNREDIEHKREYDNKRKDQRLLHYHAMRILESNKECIDLLKEKENLHKRLCAVKIKLEKKLNKIWTRTAFLKAHRKQI